MIDNISGYTPVNNWPSTASAQSPSPTESSVSVTKKSSTKSDQTEGNHPSPFTMDRAERKGYDTIPVPLATQQQVKATHLTLDDLNKLNKIGEKMLQALATLPIDSKKIDASQRQFAAAESQMVANRDIGRQIEPLIKH